MGEQPPRALVDRGCGSFFSFFTSAEDGEGLLQVAADKTSDMCYHDGCGGKTIINYYYDDGRHVDARQRYRPRLPPNTELRWSCRVGKLNAIRGTRLNFARGMSNYSNICPVRFASYIRRGRVFFRSF